MARKRIGKEPLTAAEKQRRYRAKQRAKLESLKAAADGETAPDLTAIREQVKAQLRESWEPELKAERIKETRKRARETARQADNNYTQGRTAGICQAAAFFTGKDRADIAQTLLSHFMINRKTAKAALEADKRTKSLTLASLDKAGAWGKNAATGPL